MIEKLKTEVMRQGMKLMTNPRVMKVMADPRLMNAISRGFAIKGEVQSAVEGAVRTIAKSLNIATREEVEELQRSVAEMEASMDRRDRRSE